MKVLRAYQQTAVARCIERLDADGSTLLVMATGLGKSFTFARIGQHYLPQGRIMVVQDRGEIAEQNRNEFEELLGYRPALEKADSYSLEAGIFSRPPVVCAMIQTLRGGRDTKRWERFDPNEFALLCLDEADLSMAQSYRDFIAYMQTNPNLKLLGVTATPNRHDGQDLEEIYASVAYRYPICDAIPDGWLVPVRQRYLQVVVELDGVSSVLGEFNGQELRDVLAEGDTLERIVSGVVQYAEDRRTLVFADSIANAETMTELFHTHRMGCARIVTGETNETERAATLAAYENGEFQYLLNVGVATRGFDSPGIRCIVLARPTKSITLLTQMLGRGTRTLPGTVDGLATPAERRLAIAMSDKPDALILDIVANYRRGELPKVADVLAEAREPRVRELADIIAHENPDMEFGEALAEAERRNNAEIEAAAAEAERLRLRAKPNAVDIDPFARETVRQSDADYLKRFKIPYDRADAAKASRLVQRHKERLRQGWCTYPMMLKLISHCGFSHEEAKATSFEEATRYMAMLRANNWRPLVGVAG